MGLILAVAVTSLAEEDELDSDPRVVPYNGVLEFNGEALTGNADLEFMLSDDVGCTFTEEHNNVPVFAGRFAINIGSVEAAGVDDCVFDSDAVYISTNSAKRRNYNESLIKHISFVLSIDPNQPYIASQMKYFRNYGVIAA